MGGGSGGEQPCFVLHEEDIESGRYVVGGLVREARERCWRNDGAELECADAAGGPKE